MISVLLYNNLELINEVFIDYKSQEDEKLKYIRSIEGMPILVRPHAESRYSTRIDKLKSLGINVPDRNKYYSILCNYLKGNKSKIIPKKKNSQSRIIYRLVYSLFNDDDKQLYLLEIATMITVSFPTFKDNSLRYEYLDLIKDNPSSTVIKDFLVNNCSTEYKDLILKGFISPDKPVISVNTVVLGLSSLSNFPVTFSKLDNLNDEINNINTKELKVDNSQFLELKKIIKNTVLTKNSSNLIL